MKQTKILLILAAVAILMSCNNSSKESKSENKASSDYELDRTILPIQPPSSDPVTEMDARNVTKPEPFVIKAPEGAPNIVIVLIDDIGFGATSTFGGAIKTPTFDRLLIMAFDLIASTPQLYALQHVHPYSLEEIITM